MCNDKLDNNVVSPNYVLDYPDSKDIEEFHKHVNHNDAMAEIYFKEGQEELEEDTIKLLKNNGKYQNKKQNRYDLMLVVRDQGKMIGFIELRLTQDSNFISQLFSVFVSEKHRNQGLASLMMVHAFDFFQRTGLTAMTVSPTIDSLVVYNKFGFYPLGYDDVTMEKWFKKTEEERLDQLKEEFSDLLLNLSKEPCQEVFGNQCEKSTKYRGCFNVSPRVSEDAKTNVLNWRKKPSSPPLISNSDLGVLHPSEDTKKRKAETEVRESESTEETTKKKSIHN